MNNEQLTVFLEYTKRFESIAERLPLPLRESPSQFDSEYQTRRQLLSSDIQHALIRYINLCSEEHFLHSEGLITNDIWQIWTDQMKQMYRTSLVKKTWEQLEDTYRLNQPFIHFIQSLIADE